MPELVEPISYRSTHTNPPAIIPFLGFFSIVIAACTFALCAYLATKTYYTAPPAAVAASNPGVVIWRSPQRVSVAQGEAIVKGVGDAMDLDDVSRKRLAALLLRLKDDISFDLDNPPSAAAITARKTEEGTLFGEEGSFAVIGRIRIEFTPKRIKLEAHPGVAYVEEEGGTLRRYALNNANVFSFLPPPPPAPPIPPQKAPRPIAQLAPLLLAYSDAAISALLAILLLTAGISLLYYQRLGRTLHLTWAWIKLPVAITSAACGLALGLNQKLHLTSDVSQLARDIINHPSFFASIFSAAYALIVLAVMFFPSVRKHFEPGNPAQNPSKSE